MPLSLDRCPGVLHALACRDGMLARVRVPGGLITPEQLRALAEIAQRRGDGFVDLTARANAQLRGIREDALPLVAEALAAAGLLPSAAHERVRNIFASPFAGLDAGELLDMRPIVRAFDARLLADERFTELPAKFGFALDGGGFAFDSTGADLALQAVNAAPGVLLHLFVGGFPTGLGVKPEDAVETLLQAALAALAYARSRNLATPRAWRLRRLPEAAAHVRTSLAPLLLPCPAPHACERAGAPLGVLPAHASTFANVVPLIPLGRLRAEQADVLAEIARRYAGDLRLAPWRGVVLGAMPRAALAEIRAALERAELRLDAASGYAHITACSGISGCTKALADVRADAAILARGVASAPALSDATFALAACEKRCAMPSGANVELVGGAAGYDLHINGVLAGRALPASEAIAAALRARTLSEPLTV